MVNSGYSIRFIYCGPHQVRCVVPVSLHIAKPACQYGNAALITLITGRGRRTLSPCILVSFKRSPSWMKRS